MERLSPKTEQKNELISNLKILGAMAIATASVPGAANAAIHAGLYNADGLQEICLASNGTWSSPTFGSWGGLWTVVNNNAHIYGNYASGAGNDSIVVHGTHGTWTEWRDDLSYANPIDPITFTRIGPCTEARRGPAHSTGNPSQR
jgi:hypothetical protein